MIIDIMLIEPNKNATAKKEKNLISTKYFLYVINTLSIIICKEANEICFQSNIISSLLNFIP